MFNVASVTETSTFDVSYGKVPYETETSTFYASSGTVFLGTYTYACKNSSLITPTLDVYP